MVEGIIITVIPLRGGVIELCLLIYMCLDVSGVRLSDFEDLG